MSDSQVKDLKNAILERAEALAREYDERAEHAKNEILEEAHERLRLREDREVQISKQLAERDHERRIQANELKYQRKLDILRWNLVQEIMMQLKERLKKLSEKQTEQYHQLLGQLICEACDVIDSDELIVYMNINDHRALSPIWDSFTAEYTSDRKLILSNEPIDTIGGVLVTNMYDNIRVDNRLEGRIERMADELNQIIMERLFSSVEQLGSLHVS